jgi:hypothetical protein
MMSVGSLRTVGTLRTAVSVRGVWLCLVVFDCVLMSLSQGSNQIFDPKEKKANE